MHVPGVGQRGRDQRGDARVACTGGHDVEELGAEALTLRGVLDQQADLGGGQLVAEPAAHRDEPSGVGVVDHPRPPDA